MRMTRKSFLAGLSAVTVTGWSRLFAECRPFGAGATGSGTSSTSGTSPATTTTARSSGA